MFGVRLIKIDVGESPVCVFDEPPRHELVHVVRNRPYCNRFIPERLINHQNVRKGGTEGRLRLCVRARELQTKHCELAPEFSEEPRVSGETANKEDELSRSR